MNLFSFATYANITQTKSTRDGGVTSLTYSPTSFVKFAGRSRQWTTVVFLLSRPASRGKSVISIWLFGCYWYVIMSAISAGIDRASQNRGWQKVTLKFVLVVPSVKNKKTRLPFAGSSFVVGVIPSNFEVLDVSLSETFVSSWCASWHTLSRTNRNGLLWYPWQG